MMIASTGKGIIQKAGWLTGTPTNNITLNLPTNHHQKTKRWRRREWVLIVDSRTLTINIIYSITADVVVLTLSFQVLLIHKIQNLFDFNTTGGKVQPLLSTSEQISSSHYHD